MSNPFDDLLKNINSAVDIDAWKEKMLHPVPEYPEVDRAKYILKHCAGKRVLHVGAASGELNEYIKSVATQVYALDKEHMAEDNYIYFDLDKCHINSFPEITGLELIVLGEILEHLSNPGHMLDKLRAAYKCPLLITTPNAYSLGGMQRMQKGLEMVNLDHVAYYSYYNLKQLLARSGYEITDLGWYNGKPRFSEGIALLAKSTEN